MININNKSWDKLRFSDINKLLTSTEEENFFFEFKADDETPAKLVKEVSAFSNTYGGYILLGINDDKTIGGCQKWTEQRIHTTIHDSLTPTPIFDVKKFKTNGKVIFIIKIEEGTMPPYITNKGQIFERVSSGSFPINESSKLSQLYHKHENQLTKIKNKIELPKIEIGSNFPKNVFGYLDMGFSVVCSETTELQRNFYKLDLEPVVKYIKTMCTEFSISQVGHSYLLSFGDMTATDDNGNKHPVGAGIHNFMEILPDGSVRCRVILTGDPNRFEVDITRIGYYIHNVFRDVYSIILGDRFSKIFLYAHKYERLTVLKQFVPFYNLGYKDSDEDKQRFAQYLISHRDKYGNNLMIESNRLPKNDYFLIDQRLFDEYKIRFNSENLLDELFSSSHFNLGYIDSIKQVVTTSK